MAHPLPIQSWKLIFPWVVSAVKLGASLLIRSAMFLLRRSSTRCERVLMGARGRPSGGHEPEDNPNVLSRTHEPENLRGKIPAIFPMSESTTRRVAPRPATPARAAPSCAGTRG